MGRWPYSNRYAVEECKSITTKFFKQHHFFSRDVDSQKISWGKDDEITGTIRIQTSMSSTEPYIRLFYTVTHNDTGEKSALNYRVMLSSTLCHYGGQRWWFICPLMVNGKSCNRRVSALHLSNSYYFGCRHCLNLTYKSCKKNHRYDDLYAFLGMDLGLTAKELKKALDDDF